MGVDQSGNRSELALSKTGKQEEILLDTFLSFCFSFFPTSGTFSHCFLLEAPNTVLKVLPSPACHSSSNLPIQFPQDVNCCFPVWKPDNLINLMNSSVRFCQWKRLAHHLPSYPVWYLQSIVTYFNFPCVYFFRLTFGNWSVIYNQQRRYLGQMGFYEFLSPMRLQHTLFTNKLGPFCRCHVFSSCY